MKGENPIVCGPAISAGTHRGFVQIRAHGAPLPASYSYTDGYLQAQLDEPLLGLATGQAMVIYDGDRVVASATICEPS